MVRGVDRVWSGGTHVSEARHGAPRVGGRVRPGPPAIVTGDINQIEVPYRIRIREFSQMGPAAHQVADQFVTLIQRFERTGCPVSVTLENERS